MRRQSSPVCRIDGCEGKTHANAMCQRHYRRWYRHGGNAAWTPAPRVERNPNRPLYESSAVRAEYGCIVTFENEAGLTFVMHRTGQPTKALASLCDAAEQLDPSLRVVAYSTPSTIVQDLQGARKGAGHVPGAWPPLTPEGAMLARIGRAAMLHPRLRAA